MKKEIAPETIVVGEEKYFWHIRHGWIVDLGEGKKGLSVSVSLDPGRTRELILEFPFAVFGEERSPKREKVAVALRPAIEAAITAGWKPDSRGRPFRFNVPEA
jgi:hypothetical protein